MTDQQQLVANARGMFQFIKGMKQAGSKKKYRSVSDYEDDGMVLDLVSLPQAMPWTPSGSADIAIPVLQEGSGWGLDSPIVEIPKVGVTRPPRLPGRIAALVEGGVDNPGKAPTLRQDLIDMVEGGPLSPAILEFLQQVPPEDIVAAFDDYLQHWGAWADDEVGARWARRLYLSLFDASEVARSEPQNWEFVLGLARIKRPGVTPDAFVDRPLLVVPARAEVDARNGELTLHVVQDGRFRLETDMLDPGDVVSVKAIRDIEDVLSRYPAMAFERDELMDHIRTFVNKGLRDVRLVDDFQWASEHGAVVALRPTIIHRRRRAEALIRALDSVAHQLQGDAPVPPGLAALVDPEATATRGAERVVEDGGVVFHRGEPYTPLPLNARQWDVLRRTDTRPLALVQGPPGTGKTHTTAALISHLLAQGKRILVTSARSEALDEVRKKLPEDIRNLAVSRMGSDQDENEELRSAIEELSRRATEFNPEETEAAIASSLQEIESLLSRRDELIEALIDARRSESERTSTPFGDVSLPVLTEHWLRGRSEYAWAVDLLPRARGDEDVPSFDALRRLDGELRTLRQEARSDEARLLRGDAAQLPIASDVQTAIEGLRRADSRISSLGDRIDRGLLAPLQELPTQRLHDLETAVRAVSMAAGRLRARPEPWVKSALTDMAHGKTAAWTRRRSDIASRVADVRSRYDAVRPYEPIRLPDADLVLLANANRVIAEWITRNGTPPLDGAGRPKFGMLTPRPVRQAWAMLAGTTVNGRPPRSLPDFEAVRNWCVLHDALHDLDEAWPMGMEVVAAAESPSERIAWHEDELRLLNEVLTFPGLTQAADGALARAKGLPPIAWSEASAGTSLLGSIDYVLADRERISAAAALEDAAQQVSRLGDAPAVRSALAALADRNPDACVAGLQGLREQYALRDRLHSADRLRSELRRSWPGLVDVLPVDPESPWSDRLGQLEDAWRWRQLDDWLRSHRSGDPNAVFEQVTETESRVREEIGSLAALRAWKLAVERLTPGRRADLQAFVSLIRRLGRGKGRNAARIQGDIQDVLQRASGSVPVWIMPFPSVVETLAMRPDTFDVVIVDEASQLGLEGILLAYISPRLVIVGDDKQVSPIVVGGNEDLLIPLRDQFLAWNPQRAVYTDYSRSLFDEAFMRFPDVITLVEHRRCVPDIINFSAMLAYEPYNITLIPVREPGSGALPPFVTTFVDGSSTTRTKGDLVNEREAQVLVEKVLEAINDQRCKGKEIGIISLLGKEQGKKISQMLADVLPSNTASDIRVGEPPNFQGAERKVIFLSMVASANGGAGETQDGRPAKPTRQAALVGERYVQRYNVAVSRAIDQIHLVHSIRKSDLNPEDMRYKLLDYIDGLEAPPRPQPSEPVEAEGLDSRFASRLEQDVFNNLARRSYQVVPHYTAQGGTIDLVVIGEQGKAGILCLDDQWPGEERYRQLLRFEAELLRFGWPIFRVRQTAMMVDPDGVTDEVLAFLEAAGVHPARGPVDPETTSSEGETVPTVEGEDGSHTVSPTTTATGATVPGGTGVGDSTSTSVEPTPTGSGGGSSTSGDSTETAGPVPPVGAAGLPSYTPWTPKQVPSVAQASPKVLQAALEEIVRAEGPMLAELAYRRYAKASGAARLGGSMERDLNKAAASLVRSRRLAQVKDGLAGQKTKTLYAPGTPPMVLREAGGRDLERDVPPSEVRALLEHFGMTDGQPTEAEMRQALGVYGSTGLTKGRIAFLNECARYVWE